MTKETRSHTYLRIVEASLSLFNEHGERNISTNHIANHLGISPGNLYYHFANKDDIIIQLFKRYSQALLRYLTETTLPGNLEDTVGYMAGVYNILWDYRFLFSDVNTLLVRSSTFLGEHNEFTRAQFSPLAMKLISRLKQNHLIEIDEIGMRNLAMNMWLITKYWFDFDSSLNGHDQRHDKKIKERGIYRTLSLLRPHLLPEHVAKFDEIMQRLNIAP